MYNLVGRLIAGIRRAVDFVAQDRRRSILTTESRITAFRTIAEESIVTLRIHRSMYNLVVHLVAAVIRTIIGISNGRRSACLTAGASVAGLQAIAKLSIIAALRRTRLTAAIATDIILRTGVAIIAIEGVVLVFTATGHHTGISRARLAIITVRAERKQDIGNVRLRTQRAIADAQLTTH